MCQSKIGAKINPAIVDRQCPIIFKYHLCELHFASPRLVSEEKDEFKNSVTQQLVARFNETLAICRVVPGHRKKESVCGWRENYRRDEVAINNAKWSRDASLLSPLF